MVSANFANSANFCRSIPQKLAELAPTDKFSWGSATGGPAVSITSKKRRAPKAELDSISGRNHSGKTGCNHRYRRPAGQAVRGPRGDCGHRVNLHGRAQSATAEAGSASETLSPVPAGRRKHSPSGHRLDSGQAGGPDLRDTGDVRRAE